MQLKALAAACCICEINAKTANDIAFLFVALIQRKNPNHESRH